MSDCSSKAFKVPEKPELKPCPMCGETKAIKISNCIRLEECDSFEYCDKGTFKLVVCDYSNGGCGASSGYRPTVQKAIEAWNTRYEPICHWEFKHHEEIYETMCGHAFIWEPHGVPDHCPGCGGRVKVVG